MSKSAGNARKGGRLWVVIIAAVILAGVIGNILDENPDFLSGGKVNGNRLAVLSTDARKLDGLDGREAQTGYHYYEITIEFYNSGSEAAGNYQLMGYFSGKNYDDVYDCDGDDSANPFEEAALGILPAGKSGKTVRYIQVRDGVTSLKFEYYDSSSTGSKKTTINL